jgi:outer membrane protein assembly factor BamD (BamD/ComL family)
MQVIRIDADYKDISAQLKEASRQQMLEIAYNEALNHFSKRRWSRAREKFGEVLTEEPGYRDAEHLLGEAKTQEQIADWYREAQEHLRSKNWRQAISRLEQVVELDSSYRDAMASLGKAREEQALVEWYRDGMEHFNRQSWQKAKESFDRIHEKRPDGYRDVRERLEKVDTQIRLAAQFKKAQECELAEDWSEAIGIYMGILTEDAGYPEVAERLARAQKEQGLLEKYEQAKDCLARKEWKVAIESLNWIVERKADYKDAAQKLQQAKDQQEAETSYKEGVKHFGRKEWTRAIERLQRVVALDPDNEDAARKLQDAQRNQMIADLRSDGIKFLHERQYQKAIQRFKQVLAAVPDDPSAGALLEEAKRQQQEQVQAALDASKQMAGEAAVKQAPGQFHLVRLRQILDTRFNEGGLRTLCFDLSVDYDNLPDIGKANKARELVDYLERRGRLIELVEAGKQLRPDISWDDIQVDDSSRRSLKAFKGIIPFFAKFKDFKNISLVEKINMILGIIGVVLAVTGIVLALPVVSERISSHFTNPKISTFRILIDDKQVGEDYPIGGESVNLPQLSTLTGGESVVLKVVVIDTEGTAYTGDDVLTCKWAVAPIDSESESIKTESCEALYIPSQKYSSQNVAVEVEGKETQFNPVPPIAMEFEIK